MTNKKAGLAGAAGILIAIAIPGAVTAKLLLQGFVIGFSIGSFLFPQELPPQDEEPIDLPETDPKNPIPIIWGTRAVSGQIAYFGEGKPLVIEKNDGEHRYTYQAMQIAICMGNRLRQARIWDNERKPFFIKPYFDSKGWTPLYSIVPGKKPLPSDEKYYDTPKERLSQVVWSNGEDPIYFYDYFNDPELGFVPPPKVEDDGGKYQVNYKDGSTQDIYNLPHTFADWPVGLPRLKGVCSCASPVWFLGDHAQTVPSMSFQVCVCPDLSVSSFAWQHVPGDYAVPAGVNAAHALWDAFTNEQYGMGKPEALLDEDSWLAVEDMTQQEGLLLNAAITTVVPAKDIFSTVLFHINGMVRSNDSGQLELILLRPLTLSPIINDPTAPASAIPGLPSVWLVDDHDVRDVDIEAETWSQVKTEFSATYPSAKKQFENGIVGPYKNEAAASVLGAWRNDSYHFEMFTNEKPVAQRLQQIFLQNSRPRVAVTLKVDLRYHRIRKGDGIILNSSRFGLDQYLDFDLNGIADAQGMIFRVMEVTDPDLEQNYMTIKAGIDLASYYAAAYTAPPSFEGGNGTQITALSPLDVETYVDWWKSNVSQEDLVTGYDWDVVLGGTHDRPNSGTTGDPIVFCSQILSARRSPSQTRVGYNLALGPTIPYWDNGTGLLVTPLPETSAPLQTYDDNDVNKFLGYKFTLLTSIGGDDFSFSIPEADGGRAAYLRLNTFDSLDVSEALPDSESFYGTRSASVFESDDWIMVIVAKPINSHKDYTRYAQVEAFRFGHFEKVNTAENQYRVGLLQRSANKENPQGWVAGATVWIFRLRDLQKSDVTTPDELWPHGFKGVNNPFPTSNNGKLALRVYAQGGDDERFETPFQGLVETHQAEDSNHFQLAIRANTAFCPGFSAHACRRDGMVVEATAIGFNNVLNWEYTTSGSFKEWTIEIMPLQRYPGLGDFQIDSGFSNPKSWSLVANQKNRVVNWTNESIADMVGCVFKLSIYSMGSANYADHQFVSNLTSAAITSGGNWPHFNYTPSSGDITAAGFNPASPEEVEAFHAGLIFVLQIQYPNGSLGVPQIVQKDNTPWSVHKMNFLSPVQQSGSSLVPVE